MKKFLALICMITCLLGLTACGSEETYSDYQQQKIDYAKDLAAGDYLSMLIAYSEDEAIESLSENTAEELEYLMQANYGLNIDGKALISAVTSFNSAMETIGDVTGTGTVTATVDDKQIIVDVEVNGVKKDAIAQVIVSNDMFMKLESAALNPTASMGDLMAKAALNTLIGMGTVFVVLILISLIIACFNFIPKIQAKMAAKKAAKTAAPETTGVDNAVAQIVEAESAAANLTDDLELVAVIAAAIAASEGAASTDGFVVRSIRRRAF